MTEQLVRPSTEDIKTAYNDLFKSSLTLSKTKEAALGGRLLTLSNNEFGVAGRSMAWKLFLCRPEPLKHSSNVPPSLSLQSWQISRKAYVDLLLKKMRAPDGSYEEGLAIPGISSLPKRGNGSSGNLEKNNPLSLHDENPWNAWFASVDLRKTILQDVERTFPDLAYFRDPEVQSHLTNILFVYSAENPALGYRQGMHELLAPILYAVDFDSISGAEAMSVGDPTLVELCSRTWVAADAYELFVCVMQGVGKWYEWREDGFSTGNKSPLSTNVQLNLPNGQVDIKPYVAPIVGACNRIQSTYLKSVDPELWNRMRAAGIEPQIYGIRWLRLLFTREFSMADAMVLWDGLFACDPSFELAQWICVAMLLRIRNQLMPADYSTQLTYLLRYPTPPNVAPLNATSEVLRPSYHITLLLRQASALQMAPSVATGATVVYENRNIMNIPVEVPDPPPPPMRRRPAVGERRISSSSIDNGIRRAEHSRHQSSGSMGLPELFARGLLDRGESLGINKTVMNAVSELKRNLPDLASSFILPHSQPSSFQLVDERPPEERPPWEPKSRFEVEREIAEGKLLQRKLGDAVEWIVDALLQDEDTADQDKVTSVKDSKREALESLAYVRDVLKGRTNVIDEDRLFNAEELTKRKTKEATRPDEALQSRWKIVPAIPPTTSLADQRARMVRTSGSQESLSSPLSNKAASMPSLNSGYYPSESLGPQRVPWNSSSNIRSNVAIPPRPPPPPPPTTPAAFRPSTYPPPPAGPSQEAPPRKVQQDPLGAMP